VLGVKQQLYDYCQAYISKRITTAREAIRASQDAANDETKSSAGDKYETGRAMMQLEMEKDSAQLAEAMKLKNQLDQIAINKRPPSIQPGCLVITNQGNFFVALSVGQLVVENTKYYAISMESPIGAKLKGLKQGDFFEFNTKTYKIEQVW
jgi:transcription elongation GreA/GreB family factor